MSDFWIISIHFIQKMTFSLQYLKYDAYLDRHTYIDRIAMKEKKKLILFNHHHKTRKKWHLEVLSHHILYSMQLHG